MTTSPLVYSAALGRPIRADAVDTLGVSSQTLFEQAVRRGHIEVATELARYFDDEIRRIADALFTWLEDIVAWRLERSSYPDTSVPGWCLRGLRDFNPAAGDLQRAVSTAADGNAEGVIAAVELLRVRWCSLHDALVVWIQQLLTGVSEEFGEDAVFEVVQRSYRRLWRPRYSAWETMTPLERLQLSVEGMRGHLSGRARRGDVGIVEEPDRYTMVLDPCGSCGVLRRGDPDSGRDPYGPAGNAQPHPWTWGRTGVGWYAVHSPIVMEYLPMRDGRPPLRPLADCDTTAPCRWFIYKDPAAARREHYRTMGFPSPPASAADPGV